MNFLTAPFDSLGPKTPRASDFDEFINWAERKSRVRFSLGTRYISLYYIGVSIKMGTDPLHFPTKFYRYILLISTLF